jgi:RNA polymerase sigma factor FliA
MDSLPNSTNEEIASVEIRDLLIEQNRALVTNLVAEIAKDLPSHIDQEEMFANGILGLVEAAEKYDPRRGVSFTTFAYYRIKGAIYDGLNKSSAFPRRTNAKLRFAANANEVLQSLLDDEAVRIPNISIEDELAQAQAIVDELIPIYILSLHTDYIDNRIEEVSHYERYEDIEMVEHIKLIMPELKEEDREVIDYLYFKGIPMVEMAKRLGVSKSWASRLHIRALKKLKKLMVKHGLLIDSS